MDIQKILAQLRDELYAVDAAIASLQRLHDGARRRRRSAEWLSEVQKSAKRESSSPGEAAAPSRRARKRGQPA